MPKPTFFLVIWTLLYNGTYGTIVRPSIINIISGQQVNPLFGMLGCCIKAEGSKEGIGIGKVPFRLSEKVP